MANAEKSTPSARPAGPTLPEKLDVALRDEAARRSFRVEMHVRGGLPAKAYRLEFLLAGSGEVQSQFECRLTKRERKGGRAILEPKQVIAILKAARRALELPEENPRFLPDTLIGFLEVSDGVSTRRIYFAADPEQAKTQGKVPPAAVQSVVNAIYATAAKVLGERSVKP